MLYLPMGFVARHGGEIFHFVLDKTVGVGGGSTPASKDVDGTKHFFSELVTISYTTLGTDYQTDDGVTRLSVKVVDKKSTGELCSDPIPLQNIAMPGRIRADEADGDPSATLLGAGYPYPHLWRAGGSIDLEYFSTASADNQVTMVFAGYYFTTQQFPTADAFWKALDQYMGGAVPA